MHGELPLFPEQASTVASQVDGIYFLLIAVSSVMSIGIFSTILYFAIRYRRRSETHIPKPIPGSMALELTWSILPMFVFIGFFVLGAIVYFEQVTAPAGALEIYVVGRQWMWHTQHLGGQREINGLHVPVGVPIKLTMTSQDVIHDFAIPAFRVKNDVLPGTGRYTTLSFTPTKVGKYHLFCAEYCGTEHSRMVGWVTVMEPAEFQTWLAANSDNSAATRGRQLFLELQCITCHNRESNARAPLLEKLFMRPVPLDDGKTVTADEAYLRESILRPEAKVVAGFKPIMPSFEGQVSELEMLDLITFIKGLEVGQTPDRNESTPPPTAKTPGEGAVPRLRCPEDEPVREQKQDDKR